jgi:hypothetical protein
MRTRSRPGGTADVEDAGLHAHPWSALRVSGELKGGRTHLLNISPNLFGRTEENHENTSAMIVASSSEYLNPLCTSRL